MKILEQWTEKINGHKETLVKAVCPECGKIVIRRKNNAIRQKTCGCLRKKINGIKHHLFVHGKSPKGLYFTWRGMKDRCDNVKNKVYNLYGGRGITIHKPWYDFIVFRKWSLENGWKKGLQIDRKNNNKNYTPSNCRFITSAENCQNRRNNKLNKEKVLEIRKLLNIGKGPSEIGRMFNVSETMIRKIRKNESWNNVK